MKNMRKALSMVLLVCMLMTLMPVSAFAEETYTETGVISDIELPSDVEDTTEGEDTTDVEIEDEPVIPDVPENETDAEEPEDDEIEMIVIEGSIENEEDLLAASVIMGTRPEPGISYGLTPYPASVSPSYRGPAAVVLNSGRIVLAGNVMWNTTYDGGGLDTIVSYSDDQGATWHYSVPNYFGDNGDVYNHNSASFIDPALATDGNTVYMLVDVQPYGVSLNGNGSQKNPTYDTGFDNQGRLLLCDSTSASYDYYLENGRIYYGGNPVEGYTVDEYFNIYWGNGNVSNLFLETSPFRVQRTMYLYITKSYDGGASWSAPVLIPNVKRSTEMACLAAPATGIVSNGAIIFPCYSYSGTTEGQRMGFLISSDGGYTWSRSADMTGASWSSESSVVRLDNDTLRFFYRNGTARMCYVDYVNDAWQTPVQTSVPINSNTQISSTVLPKTYDGKKVLAITCPSGSGSNGSTNSSHEARNNGKIHFAIVNDDKTLDFDTIPYIVINNSMFLYSCVKELYAPADEMKLFVAYEDSMTGWGVGRYAGVTYTIKSTSGFDVNAVTLSDPDTGVAVSIPGLSSIAVEPNITVDALSDTDYVAYDITLNDGEYTDRAEVTLTLPENILAYGANHIRGFVVEADGSITEITGSLNGDRFTFTAPHFSVVGANGLELLNNEVNIRVGETVSYTDDEGNFADSYTGAGLNSSIATVTVENINESTTDVVTWTRVTNGAAGIKANGEYLILSGYNGNVYALNSTGGRTSVSVSNGVISGDVDSSNVFTFVSNGSGYSLRDANGTYLYPNGTRNGTWSYSLSTRQSAAQALTISGTDYVSMSRSVTSGSKSTTAYITYNNGFSAGSSASNLYLFEKTVTPGETTSKTLVTITGVSKGSTSVAVGGNRYSINVTRDEKQLTVILNNTLTVTDAYAAQSVSAETDIVTVTADGNQLTFTPVAEGTATVENPGTKYTVVVSTAKTASIRLYDGYTLSLKTEEGETVEWTSADENYVSVFPNLDGASLKGNTVTDTPVLVTATVKNAQGETVRSQKWLVSVKNQLGVNSSVKEINISIKTIEHCTVYYSINGGELVEISSLGSLINDKNIVGHFRIDFFAAPDPGYALMKMSATESAGQYYCLSNGDAADGSKSDAWPLKDSTATDIPTTSDDSAWKDGHGTKWPLLEGNYIIDDLRHIYTEALSLGCDGVTGFTKNKSDGLNTVLEFIAEPLPTIKKEVVSITTSTGEIKSYTSGMDFGLGDKINYKLTVTKPQTTNGTITYSDVKVTDELTGDQFDLNLGITEDGDVEYPLYVDLTVTMANYNKVVKNGEIVNSAELKYTYKTVYSSGSLGSQSTADATVTVTVPAYVIDFGLPVSIDLSTQFGSATIVSGEAKFGTVTPNGTSFTYTPTSILTESDFVTLTLSNGDGYGVRIYPATTVYYEESFANELHGSANSGSQTAQIAGGYSEHPYGYDANYAGVVGASNGSEYEMSGSSKLTYNFTGTGFELYANTNETSGLVFVQVKTEDGKTVKLYQVDTHMQSGESNATAGQNVTAYNEPIISAELGSRQNYTVIVSHVSSSNPVKLDGIRVHGTLPGDSLCYVKDLEDNPSFIELRNNVLNMSVPEGENATQTLSEAISKLNDVSGTEINAVLIKQGSNTLAGADSDAELMLDLMKNGPKNEIYLQPGQTLAFNVATSRVTQLGMRAVNAGTTASVNGNTVNVGSTDMFYKVFSNDVTGAQKSVTVTNNGSGILSVTKLKICDDPYASVAPMTDDDIIFVLAKLGMVEKPNVDAVLEINVNGKEAVLTKNGPVGETVVFTAEEIAAAANSLVETGYQLNAKVFDMTVEYGETSFVWFAEGQFTATTLKDDNTAEETGEVITAEPTVTEDNTAEKAETKIEEQPAETEEIVEAVDAGIAETDISEEIEEAEEPESGRSISDSIKAFFAAIINAIKALLRVK